MQEVSVNKKVVWLGLLSIAVFLAGGIAYYISTQEDLTSNSTDGGVKVEEDAIEIVTAPADGSSSANGGATGGAGSTSADGDTAGAGGKKVAGDGLSDEEREARAIELAQAVGKATPGASGDGNVVSKADIMEAITRVKPLVKDCYDRMLDDFPDAEGKIVVQLKVKAIEGIGEVEAVKVGDDEKTDLFDTKMHECMSDALGFVTFPIEGEEDAEVIVNYPFSFQKK